MPSGSSRRSASPQSLQHPHILPLFDSGSAEYPPEAGGWLLWYVMPFVEGETLRSRLAREGRLPVDDALQLVREMADALEHAHRHGVVHRDVKPENVLLQDGHALVADFGIALALEHAGGERLTRTGITLGTPQYMAPEQADGERAIDARADVYALGAVLHEMLAGESPFAAASHAGGAAARDERAADGARDAPRRRGVVPRCRGAAGAGEATRGSVPERGGIRGGARRAGRRGPQPARRARARWVVEGTHGVRARRDVRRRRYARHRSRGRLGARALAAREPMDRRRRLTSRARRPTPSSRTHRAMCRSRSSTAADVRCARSRRIVRGRHAFSPDGRRVAYGAFGAGRSSSDIWVTDLDAGTTQRLTDDDGDSNDPQWSADGATLAYSVNAPGGKDLLVRRVDGGEATVLARARGDAVRERLAARRQRAARHGGSREQRARHPRAAGGWVDGVAVRGDVRGRDRGAHLARRALGRVYLRRVGAPGSVPRFISRGLGRRVAVSWRGGVHPVWRGDGRELYYWKDGALVAAQVGAATGDAPPTVGPETVLFRAPYLVQPNTMYDVSRDGQRFVIVRQP